MTKSDWEVEKFSETKKLDEHTIKASLSESLANGNVENGNECIVPPARLSMAGGEVATVFTNSDSVEFIIEQISVEFKAAHHSKYEPKQAELTAALCLEAQKQLAQFLSDAELLSKERKAEVERIEAERYFHYKENKSSLSEKITDVALNRMVAKDPEVLSAKREQYVAEADFGKYKNLFGVLKDAHIFFRSLAKGNSEWG
jgi:hypothetical protein